MLNKAQAATLLKIWIRQIYSGEDVCYKLGVESLDRKVLITDGSFNLFGARPGGGKTRFIIRVLNNWGARGIKTCYISLEDSTRKIAARDFELYSGIKVKDFYDKKYPEAEIHKMIDKMIYDHQHFAENVIFRNIGKASLDKIVAIITEMRNSGVKNFIIDYLQAIGVTKAKGEFDRNSEIAETLRDIAVKQNLCINGIVQLNRQAETVIHDNPPTISEIKGSGAYEQTACTIILIKRKGKKCNSSKAYFPTNFVEFYVLKNRDHGWLGRVITDEHYVEASEESLKMFFEEEGSSKIGGLWGKKDWYNRI